MASGYLYHYTDWVGVNAIANSGYIKASPSGGQDAVYGSGVYFTALPPSTPTYQIIWNNWDDGRAALNDPSRIAKTTYYIAIPISSLPGVRQVSAPPQRDVWLYPGGDVILQGKGVVVYQRM